MSLSNPKVSLSILNAQTIAPNEPQRVLLVGQKTSAGSAVSGSLVQDIQNDGSENALFGDNSMLADMVRAFKRTNKFSRLDAIPLSDNGAGVAATGTITFAGSPTAAGSFTFYIGSSINFIYTVDVATTDTPTSLAAALAALINADTNAPVTAAAALGVVTLTAVNKGTVGNGIGLQYTGSAAGITVAFVAMASGATNPTLTGLFNVVDGIRYQTVVYPSEYTLSVLTTNFLDERFNVENDILDGVGIITATDTFANLKTLGNANNTQSLVIFGNQAVNRDEFKGGAIFEMTYNISSYFAAVRSLRFTQDVNISRYIIGGQSNDQFGGAALASLPYFNTPFFNLPITLVSDEFSQDEIDELLDAGVSVMGNNLTNNLIICGDVATTYKTDAGGNPDLSYKFLNYVDTISNVREFYFNNLKLDCRQSRLTEGDLVPNRKMHNAGSITSLCVGYFQLLSGQDFVLLQAGENALQFYKQNLVVTLDLSLGKATITMKAPIVTQLREIIGTIQIAFSTNN